VPAYYLRIPNGRYRGASDAGLQLPNNDRAWVEMTKVCGDLVGDVLRDLEQNTQWRMELLNASMEPLFRIRIMAETLD
jgi:hypothetical protein